MRSFTLLLLSLCLVPFLPGSGTARDVDDKPIREIFVPVEDLHAILEAQPERVMLSRSEFKELMSKAKRPAVESPPWEAVLVSADYQASLDLQRATIRGKLVFEVLTEGIHAVQLAMDRVSILAARLNGRSAPLGRSDSGSISVFLDGIGSHELELEIVTPLQTAAASQTLQVLLPFAPASRLGVDVPGNVELRSGAAVLSRTVQEAAERTVFELLPPRGMWTLIFSLNNRLRQTSRVVAARSVLVDEVTLAYERLHGEFTFEVLQGSAESFTFLIPDTFEITRIDSPLLARWEVDGEAEGMRRIAVRLREPTREQVRISVSATRNQVLNQAGWELPRITLVDVHDQVSLVGVIVEDRLQADSFVPTSLISINTDVLRAALPETVFEAEPGAPQLRPVVAYYAPQADFSLQARLTLPSSSMETMWQVRMHVREQGLEAEGVVTMLPQVDKLFFAEFLIPSGWRIEQVQTADGQALPIQTLDSVEQLRVRVMLPSGVPPGETTTLRFTASSVPAGWLDAWEQTQIDFPDFRLVGVEKRMGSIAVQPAGDLEIRPESTAGLRLLDDDVNDQFKMNLTRDRLAYRFDEQPFEARFVVRKRTPHVTVRGFEFFELSPLGLQVHYEIIYQITEAETRTLAFELPASAPRDISVQGLGDVRVQSFYRSGEDDQHWVVQLAEQASGEVRIAVDFEQELDFDEGQVTLPILRAQQVAYESIVVAVEGNPELDVAVESDARRFDVGELVDAQHTVGRRLLGVFGLKDSSDVVVRFQRRPGYGLPTAIVQRCEFVTSIASTGLSQTSARYLLLTKANFLRITLPSDAELWAATVDGEPAAPQREGEHLLLELPPTDAAKLRDLQLVYQLPASGSAMVTRVDSAAPALLVRNEEGEGYDVPVADVQWHVLLPTGQQLIRTAGTVHREELPEIDSPILAVLKALYRYGGGIHPLYLSKVTSVRESRAPASGKVQHFLMDSQVVDAEEAASDALSWTVTDEAMPLPEQTKEEGRLAGLPQDAPETPAPTVPTEKYWALEGVRSLPVDLQWTGEAILFQSMGGSPRLEAYLLNQPRATFLSWLFGGLVLVAGAALARARWKHKFTYVLAVALTALLLPLLLRLTSDLVIDSLFHRAFYAATLLIPLYVLWQVIAWIKDHMPRLRAQRAAVAASAGLMVCLLGNSAGAQRPPAKDWLERLARPVPIQVPRDAVIVPYDPAQTVGVPQSDRLFVPYETYLELYQKAYPDDADNQKPPPAEYAWAGATYRTTLNSGLGDRAELVIEGELDLEVFVDEAIDIPLRFGNAVLTKGDLDGRPAKMRVLSPEPPVAVKQQAAGAEEIPSSLLAIHVEGKGRKQLQIQLRVRLTTSGGWRMLHCQLPHTPASEMQLTVPTSGTELMFRGIQDRSNYETQEANESLRTAMPLDGWLRLQWREQVAIGQIDQTLTAQSTILYDVTEDGVRLTWKAQLESRRAERESFTLRVPSDYFVEAVGGENVRGFEVTAEETSQRIDIMLLEPITGVETMIVHLSSETELPTGQDTSSRTLATPALQVAGAILHRGYVLVRRSPYLDLWTSDATGLQRAETDLDEAQQLASTIESGGPLGIRSHQAWRFATEGFQLGLQVTPLGAEVEVVTESLLKLSSEHMLLETRLRFDVRQRPLYQTSIQLPRQFEVSEVLAPGLYEQAMREDGDARVLDLYFHQGLQGVFSIVLRGRIPANSAPTHSLPQIRVKGADEQRGHIVIQTDPGNRVSATQLQNCETVLLQSVNGWLTPEQRNLARLALRYRQAGYSGQLLVEPKTPQVSSLSVTNVRITSREIQTTLFVRYTIREAGIRELMVTVPSWMRDARWTLPMLRQKTIEAIEGDPDRVRVRLELQEEVIDELIIVAEHDQPLMTDAIPAAIPESLPGRTDDQFVVLENVGRDEVVVRSQSGTREIYRQQPEWQRLAQVMDNPATRAFVIVPTEAHELSFETRQRVAVQTAEAHIRLAETLLLMDSNGVYRGQQTYRVDNKTEPYLEVRLPDGAVLWTAAVAQAPVKPARADGSQTNVVRIPLLKTAPGDLDYDVQLKYGGRIERPGSLEQVKFPLIHTVNIQVEQSQVRLRLPKTHHWMRFDGTLRRVVDEGDLAAGFLSYRNQQIESLSGVLGRADVDEFTRVRAASNLKLAVDAAKDYQSRIESRYAANSLVQEQVRFNELMNREAEKQIFDIQKNLSAQATQANRDVLLFQCNEQLTTRGKNVVDVLGSNFAAPGQVAAAEESAPSKANESDAFFDYRWLEENRLATDPDVGRKSGERFRNAEDKKIDQLQKGQTEFFQMLGEGEEESGVRQQDFADNDNLQQQLQRYQRRLEADSRMPAPANQPASQDSEPMDGFGLLAGEDGGAFGPMDPHSAVTGLTSLEVELPGRGVEFLFTTPRGEIQLEARAIEARKLSSLLEMVALFCMVGGIFVARSFWRRMRGMMSRRGLAVSLILIGIISLLGILPLLGLVAIIAGCWMFFANEQSAD